MIDIQPLPQKRCASNYKGMGVCVVKFVVQGLAKPLLVKILVVAATTQMGTVACEVEKGSL